MTAMTSKEALTTTTSKYSASRTSLFSDVTAIDDANEVLFDFMDGEVIRALSQLPAVSAVSWVVNGSLTALSYDYYKTVSYWWIILAYNGFIHPSSIKPGSTVNIPDISSLKTRLAKSARGTVVTI